MLTKLDSFIKCRESANYQINHINKTIDCVWEISRDVDIIYKVAEKHNAPGLKQSHQSVDAMLLCIMAEIKASRSHYIALIAKIEALNDFINLTHYS